MNMSAMRDILDNHNQVTRDATVEAEECILF